MKRSWNDGTSHIILSAHELSEKLSSIVPPPRANTTRYHGILAPNSKQRAKVVPSGADDNDAAANERKKSGSTKYRLTFAALLARVFQIDVSVCPVCQGKMKIIAFITDPASVRRYLEGEGLPTDAPPIVPARSPPQIEFDY